MPACQRGQTGDMLEGARCPTAIAPIFGMAELVPLDQPIAFSLPQRLTIA
ncbi:hypothetical protein P792_04550 [Asaia sp. SF2.1]|nr:hypothetical protein P792_04550 [Asaia sp. SF2.1]